MSGGGQKETTVQDKTPWAPSQQHLINIMGQGQQLYNSGAGSQTWGGPLMAQQADQTTMGLQSLGNTAQAQGATANQPYNYAQNMIQSGGMIPGMNRPMGVYGNVASGQNGINTGQDFRDIATGAMAPTAAQQNLGGMASGADAGKNPYLTQMLDDNAARISNRVNSSMSGAGRYGSFGHAQALTDSIASANNPVLAQAYESDRNRMLSATGQIDASRQAQDALRMGAVQGMTGVQGQNIANQMGAAGGMAGILQGGQANAANWASMIPQLQASAYTPGNQMMAAGDYVMGRDQTGIDKQRQLFEQQQQMPWTQLGRYSGAVSGLGSILQGMGQTTGTSTKETETPWTQYAGLGIAGLGLMSDRNTKTDITKLGDDEATGLPLYSYRYKGDPKSYPKIVGPMAQDVEKHYPGSTEKVGGTLYIKSEALGILGLAKKEAA